MNVPNSVCSSQAQQNGSSSKPSPGGPTRPAAMSDSMRNGQVDDEGKSYCNMANEQDALEPIAVIGMAVKFPQDASSVEGFWQMLLDGRSSLTEIPKDRMNIDAYYHPDKDHFGTTNVRGGHFIKDDISSFDAAFFSMSPIEAASLDPQQRWLLETTYQALENAGIPLDTATGSNTSVHVGSFQHDHADLLKRDPEFPGRYRTTGALQSLLANRLSWFFNFTSASVTIDTACSSTMHALHLSCQALRLGESTMGIVAGSNIFYDPHSMLSMFDQGVLSPDSTCYTFDDRANGYVRGEGVGVLVLKPLSLALRDGDTVRVVIRSTGINQDGRTPGGITQPSSDSQVALIKKTYQQAALNKALTRYVEAHGTGTPLGDPIEANAIATAFGDVSREAMLVVGAVKPNVGHLEATSGLAAMVKTILVLEHGVIPPNINFRSLNPEIKEWEWGLEFPRTLAPWPASGLRRASVNTFGLGGSNGHAILDDAYHFLRQRNLTGRHATRIGRYAPQLGSPTSNGDGVSNGSNDPLQQKKPLLFVWSTSDQGGATRLLDTYTSHFARIEDHSDGRYLHRLAYTLSDKRSHLAWRCFAVARTFSELRSEICRIPTTQAKSEPRALVFVFTGQGAQWHAMGREMFVYKTFKSSIEAADKLLRRLYSSWSVESELLRDTGSSRIDDPALSHLLCVAVQVALVDLLRSWKVVPSAVVGHSSGEIAAAYCAGALSFDSVIKLAYYRGVVASDLKATQLEPHGMLAVGLSASSAQEYIASSFSEEHNSRLAIACINSPKNVTIAGPVAALHKLKAIFDMGQVFTKLLRVNVAYHTDFMRPGVERYRELIGKLEPSLDIDPTPTIVSSVTGQVITKENLQKPEYWAESLTSQVKFSTAVSYLCSQEVCHVNGRDNGSSFSIDCCLEIGPHSAMHLSLTETLREIDPGRPLHYASLLQRGRSAFDTVLSAIGRLHCLGVPVDIAKVNDPTAEGHQQLVNLPPYPFNHTKLHWDESRMNRNTRLRQFPRHDLLGSPVSDWNQFEAKWRNYIAPGENPWVAGHKINGQDVSPATGMLVMAMEAMHQVLDMHTRVARYKFRDVVLHKALAVPKAAVTPAVETEFHLRRPLDGAGKSPTWATFSFYMFDTNDWVKCGQGSISAENDDSTEPFWVNNVYNTDDTSQQFDTCDQPLDSEELYNYLAASGLQYGPMFRGLRHVYHNGSRKATATTNLHHWKLGVSGRTLVPHVIHPAALDTVLQLAFPTVSDGCQGKFPTYVPTRIDALWVSTSLSRIGQGDVRIFAETLSKSAQRVHAACFAVDPENGKKCIELSFHASAVASSHGVAASRDQNKALCYKIEIRPDLDLLNGRQTELWCSLDTNPYVPDDALSSKRARVCFLAMSKLCKRFGVGKAAPSRPELHRYLDWARARLEEASINSPETPLGHEMDNEQLLAFYDEIENSGPEGKLISQVARNLDRFFTGEITAVEFLLNDDAINNMYTQGIGIPNVFEQVARFVDALAHKNPNMRILEVGAGMGSATACVLEALAHHAGRTSATFRFAEYCYTDISPAFLVRGQERFSSYVTAGQMTFATLDIAKDPKQQGFEAGTYDLVVALNVIHATPSISQSLENCRVLLKPGGRLLLVELTGLHLMPLEFVFGLFPGWWLSTEEHRQSSPLMSEEHWHAYLEKAGFSGIDSALRNHQGSTHHAYSAMISTATEFVPSRGPLGSTIIVVNQNSLQQIALATKLQEMCITDSNWSVINWSEIANHNAGHSHYVFLVEVDRPLLYKISSTNFLLLKQVFSSAKSILWVMDGADPNPFTSLMTGLHRTYTVENGKLPFATFYLAEGHVGKATADNIAKVFCTMQGKPLSVSDAEYLERDGLLHIRRVVETDSVNQRLLQASTEAQVERQRFGQHPQGALKLEFKSPGLVSTLHFAADSHVLEPLQDDEIEVKLKYSGLNFRDVLTALGQLDGDILGLEGTGIVTRAGVLSGFAVGDCVCGLFLGSFRTFARCKAKLARLIPEPLDLQSAATLPIAFGTAYHSLVNLARLQPGESILIHSGAGGLGQAAIQIAMYLKAEIFTTVGAEEKRQLLISKYKIDPSRILFSRSLSFAEHIKRLTNGRGVDVVLNSLSGEKSRASWECIAPFGRFIETGRRDIEASEPLPMASFLDDTTLSSVNFINLVRRKPDLVSQILGSILDLAASSQISPPSPIHVYPIGQIEDAIRFMQGGKSSGKIVIRFREEDHVPILRNPEPPTQFRPDASYVIAGGLGGLGRAITTWMLSRGARFFILLSRSRKTDEDTLRFLDGLRSAGATAITPVSNICDMESLANALYKARMTMPPIKGCIQAAMVLKNSQFDAMSHADFELALGPKVHGSWNLHVLLPRGLDFFILCSSVAGIVPSFGQSNYAAGNTFQDALARYRNHHGEKAVSLDFGMLVDVGFVASHAGLAERLIARNNIPLHAADLLRVIDYYCNDSLPVPSPEESQAIIGLHPAYKLRALGLEEPHWLERPLFSHLAHTRGPNVASGPSPHDPTDSMLDIAFLLETVDNIDTATEHMTNALVAKLAKMLVMDPSDIERNQPAHAHGLDSLVAMELREWFRKVVHADITVFEIQGNDSIASLARSAVRRSDLIQVGSCISATGVDE